MAVRRTARKSGAGGLRGLLFVLLPLSFFGIGLFIAACSGQLEFHRAPTPPGPSPLSGVGQLLVVVTHDWRATDGRMQAFEKRGDGWESRGVPLPIVVGRNGMGWGHGLHAPQHNGPIASEGDGRAPAGAFELGSAFGFAPGEEMRLRYPYFQELPTTECVDDVRSRFYNMIVDRSAITTPDWNSSEKMAEAGDDYRFGIVIKQNDPPMPGGGSCIFLHAWSSTMGTAGCTGLEPERVQEIMRWLDPDKRPVLVQMPADEYERFRRAWRLPTLPPPLPEDVADSR